MDEILFTTIRPNGKGAGPYNLSLAQWTLQIVDATFILANQHPSILSQSVQERLLGLVQLRGAHAGLPMGGRGHLVFPPRDVGGAATGQQQAGKGSGH